MATKQFTRFLHRFLHCSIGSLILALLLVLTIIATCAACEDRFETLLTGLGATATIAAVYVALFKESILRELNPITVRLDAFNRELDLVDDTEREQTVHYYHILVKNESRCHYIRNPRLILTAVSQKNDTENPPKTIVPILLKPANRHWQDVPPGFHDESFFDIGELDIPNGSPEEYKFHLQVGKSHELRKRDIYTINKGEEKRVCLHFEADNLTNLCESEFSISVAEKRNGTSDRNLVVIQRIGNP